jgi:hypothetical protein
MGSTRIYDFSGGFTTATTPTATAPSASDDLVTKGYGDTTWARRVDVGWKVADTAALQALGTTGDEARSNGQLRLKLDTHDLWEFRSASSSTADGTTIIQPTSGTGRWHVVSGGAGGSSSGSANNLEILAQKLENERNGIITESLDNSVGVSGFYNPNQKSYLARMIENESSGVSTLYLVWNPVVVNNSDKNYDSTSSWSAVGDAASLSTSATSPKVGTNKFTFNKSNAATGAGIRYDQGSQIFGVGSNYRVWFWVNMPSVTNLSNIYLRMYADTTSNYRTWTCTTDYAGNALAIGWNLCFVDISSTTNSTATGTGWTYTTLSRYQEIGVTTSSSAQTYTAIAFDGLWFSHGDQDAIGLLGKEITIYNTSTKETLIISSANTRHDGPVTVTTSTANAYNGGISNSDAAGIQRSVLTSSNGVLQFDSALSSGTIATSQGFRIATILRESLSLNLKGFVDISTPQVYKVTSVSGSTGILVDDAANTSSNCVSADVFDVFETVNNGGDRFFVHRGSYTLTANSSASAGTTTFTVTANTSVAVGDYIAKRHHTFTISCVGKTTNESFSAPTLSTAPNGVQMFDSGQYYPNQANIYGHWWLGGFTSSEASRNRFGTGDLTVSGSMNTADSFYKGRNSASGYTTTAYLYRNTGLALDALSELVQGSVWVYYDATNGSSRDIVTCWERYSDNTRAGWRISVTASAATVELATGSGSTSDSVYTTSATLSVGWNHVAWSVQSGTIKQIWVNGVLETTSSATIAALTSGTNLWVGIHYDANNSPAVAGPATNLKIADLVIWRNGSTLTTGQIQQIYNNRIFLPVGFSPRVRYVYELQSQTGQKISAQAQLARTTTGVNPAVLKMGAIKV